VQRRLTPSVWYDEYRAIGNFFLNLRLFLESNARENNKGLVKEAVEGLEKFGNDSQAYFETLISQLVKNDVDNSNAIRDMEQGTFPALEAEAIQNDEVIDTPPIARTGHFAFALLDLIQQSIKPSYPKWVDESIKLAVYVTKTTKRTFLRRKALEMLLSIGRMEGVGLVNIERELSQSTGVKKLTEDWRETKRQGEWRANFQARLSSIVVDSKSTLLVNPL
jgi:hypothetical protein